MANSGTLLDIKCWKLPCTNGDVKIPKMPSTSLGSSPNVRKLRTPLTFKIWITHSDPTKYIGNCISLNIFLREDDIVIFLSSINRGYQWQSRLLKISPSDKFYKNCSFLFSFVAYPVIFGSDTID